jgi:hypothetical protein
MVPSVVVLVRELVELEFFKVAVVVVMVVMVVVLELLTARPLENYRSLPQS